MKKQLKHRKDERLYQWIDRLVEYYVDNDVAIKEMEEILREVSVQSYIQGMNSAHKVYGGVMARKGGEQ